MYCECCWWSWTKAIQSWTTGRGSGGEWQGICWPREGSTGLGTAEIDWRGRGRVSISLVSGDEMEGARR